MLLVSNNAFVLWRCWLGGRKGIRPVKKLDWWGASMVICLERDADLHMAQLMPLPLADSFFSKIQIGFTFLVPDHPGSPGKRAVKRVCVCVCVCVCCHQQCSVLLSAEKRWIGISLFPDRITASYHLCGMRDIMTSTLDNMINKLWIQLRVYDTIRYDTRCYFNVRSKADISQLNLPHGTDN